MGTMTIDELLEKIREITDNIEELEKYTPPKGNTSNDNHDNLWDLV